MERLPLIFNKNKNAFVIQEGKSGNYLLDLSSSNESLQINVLNNNVIDLLVKGIKGSIKIDINIEENSSLHLAVLHKNASENIEISVNVGRNSTFSTHYADFIPGKCKATITVNLNDINATCDWHLASLSEKEDKKEFDVSVYHRSPSTFAHLDNYGVVRDNGKLVFSGICKINKGSSGSKAHQNAKIVVFDELSNGIAKPILKIDENDIEASHAAVVGKVNDDHIFYLTSRGLNVDEAKRLITLGYLKPILNGFLEDEIKEEIAGIIEGKM